MSMIQKLFGGSKKSERRITVDHHKTTTHQVNPYQKRTSGKALIKRFNPFKIKDKPKDDMSSMCKPSDLSIDERSEISIEGSFLQQDKNQFIMSSRDYDYDPSDSFFEQNDLPLTERYRKHDLDGLIDDPQEELKAKVKVEYIKKGFTKLEDKDSNFNSEIGKLKRKFNEQGMHGSQEVDGEAAQEEVVVKLNDEVQEKTAEHKRLIETIKGVKQEQLKLELRGYSARTKENLLLLNCVLFYL